MGECAKEAVEFQSYEARCECAKGTKEGLLKG